jgi:RNA polymerase sigma factor (sigma-70 family)
LVLELREVVAPDRHDATDDELLERFRAEDDPRAFEAIVRRHGGRVLAGCRKVLDDAAEVEDVFQATFLVLLRQRTTIRQPASLGGWLYGVAHRLALKARSRSARRAQAESGRPAGPADGPPDLSWREACAILHEELDRLPDTYRLPLLLCYLEGKSRDEAAGLLGCSVGALHGRLERGRDRLRSRLLRRGVTLSAGLLSALTGGAATANAAPDQVIRALLAATRGPVAPGVAGLVRAVSPGTLGHSKLCMLTLLVVGLMTVSLGLSALSGQPDTAAPLRTPEVARERKAEKVAPPEKVRNPDIKPIAVSGKVVGPDGKIVRGAKLFVFDSEEWKPAPQAEANGDGTFTFELPPIAGRRAYRYVVASAPGLGLGCDWVGVPAATDPLRNVVLKLPRDVPIRGRILDLEGKPVEGARIRVTDLQTGKDDSLNEFVRLWSKDRERQQEAFRTLLGKRLFVKNATAHHFSATTDADGRFTLAGLGSDRCPQLDISAPGKASMVCLIPIRADFKPAPGGFTGSLVVGPEFTLPLAPSKLITGVVRDEAKKPLAGVRVLGQVDLNDETRFLNSWVILPEVETITDAEGRYTLDGLPGGRNYILAASPKAGDGIVHGFISRRDNGPDAAPIRGDFELPRGVVLTGQITDEKTGKGVRGYVFYRPLESNPWEDEHPITGSPGIAPWVSDMGSWTDIEGRFRLTAEPGAGILHVQVLDRPEYAMGKLAKEDDTDEIVVKSGPLPGTFKTRGQGGHFGIMNVNAYRVLRIPAGARAYTANVTVEPKSMAGPTR